MKRSIEYGFRLCALGLLLLVSGCASEEMNVNGSSSGGEEVIFSLSLPGSGVQTRALSTSAESEIKTLDVLVFKEVASGQELFDYRFPVDPSSISTGSPRQFRAKVKLMNERQNFVLIANAANEVNLLSAAGQPKADVLKALDINNAGKWNVGSNYRALPMWGETGPVTVNSSSSTLPATITLYRMQAKIDLSVSATAQTKFALKEIYLFNHNTRGRVVPDTANWSSGTAVAATLPSPSGTVTTPSWRYDASDGVTVTAAQNLIYLFETKAQNSGDPTDEFAVVVGGNYLGNTTLSYYRIDIEDASHTSYADVLRNYRYDIEIADVVNAGSPTPDGAFQGGVTLNATITAWNLANQSTTIDPTNTLELDSTVAVIPYNAGGVLNFGIRSANNWTISTTNLSNATAIKQGTTTLEITSTSSNPSHTSERACGWIDITTANLKYKLLVTQAPNSEYYPDPHNGWAGSNIYWDAALGHLTFDDVNVKTHQYYQGVYFQWGSLWGIDPSGAPGSAWATNKTVYRLDAAGNHVPVTTGNTWNSFPRVKDASITSNPPSDKTARDRAYLYEIHDPAQGVGDICRLLTEKGWAPGSPAKKWRMPTSQEFEAAANYTRYGTWALVSSNKAAGQFTVGPGYTKTGTGTPAFPASGYRSASYPSYGTLYGVGTNGYYWSGSPRGTQGYYLDFSSGNVSPGKYNYQASFTVRCVAE